MSERFWNKLSKNYDKKAKDKAYDLIIAKSRKYLKKDHTIMDFGCATGLYSIAFANRVKTIHAFDTAAKMIQVAKRESKCMGTENIIFYQTNLFDKRFGKNSYQTVLALNILLYFKDTEKVLRRTGELLETGGVMITSTACLKEKRTFAAWISQGIIFALKTFKILPYLKFFSITELEGEIEGCGFKIIETAILIDTPATEYYIVAQKIGD